MLAIFAVATNHLIKTLIDQFMPTESSYYGIFGSSTLPMLLASVVIAFPVYLGLNIWANKMLGDGRMRYNTGVRTWLLYLTITVVVLVVVGQLVYLLITFLGGGLPLRVGLHALISIIISLAVLWYHWWQLKFFDGTKKALPMSFRVFEWVSMVIILAAVVWGFASIENPAAKRVRENDARRVSLLGEIEGRIERFYGYPGQDYDQGLGRLPKSFEDLEAFKEDYASATEDPFTSEPFEYKVTGSRTYQLCATFETEVNEETVEALRKKYSLSGYYGYSSYGYDKDWYHPAGYHCFDLEVNR